MAKTLVWPLAKRTSASSGDSVSVAEAGMGQASSSPLGCSTMGEPLAAASCRAMAEAENFLASGGVGAVLAVSEEPGWASAASVASVIASGSFGSEGEEACAPEPEPAEPPELM